MGVLSGLLDLLYPPRCVFCRKLLKKGERSICEKCGDELPYTVNGGGQRGDFFSVCVAPLYYEGMVRESILRYKFNEADYYAQAYGALVAECIRDNLHGRYDLISWVPISRKRHKERGYDQAMLLAVSAARELDDAAVSTLEKYRDVAKQSGMGSAEKRRANISGAYRAVDPGLIEGRRVLLIDYIVTTGSTLSECARILLQSGAREVVCAAIARSRD